MIDEGHELCRYWMRVSASTRAPARLVTTRAIVSATFGGLTHAPPASVPSGAAAPVAPAPAPLTPSVMRGTKLLR